eukprot:339956_1
MGLKNVYKNKDGSLLVRNDKAESFTINSLYIHPQSDKISEVNMVGIVVYTHNGATNWRLNGITLSTGAILLVNFDKISKIQTTSGVLAKAYKYWFNIDYTSEHTHSTILSGFAFYQGKWKFNSYTFNAATDGWHNHLKAMNAYEIELLEYALHKTYAAVDPNVCNDDDNKDENKSDSGSDLENVDDLINDPEPG